MKEHTHMPIREFSRLSGIRRENLRFYDQIGLLSPELRGENNYRYYSRRQLDMAFLISDMRALGVSLEEIRQYACDRSPDKMLALFSEQDAHIESEIKRLRSLRELMRIRTQMARQALAHGKNALFLEEKAEEPIFLCPAFENDIGEEDKVLKSYDHAESKGINLGYPFGAIVSSQMPEGGVPSEVLQYYFRVYDGYTAYKPAGTYAVAYGRCAYGGENETYLRLFSFLEAKGLHPVGDLYEEYPLDEMSIQDEEQYAVRIEVPVG